MSDGEQLDAAVIVCAVCSANVEAYHQIVSLPGSYDTPLWDALLCPACAERVGEDLGAITVEVIP